VGGTGLELQIIDNRPHIPLSLRGRHQYSLPTITSILFSKNLFSRTLLETDPPKVRFICQQDGCQYSPSPQLLSNPATSNLWKHYNQKHSSVAYALKNFDKSNATSSTSSIRSSSSFFTPREKTTKQLVDTANTAKY
jgi:hypothetical protein